MNASNKNNPAAEYLSKEGVGQLREDLEKLKAVKRKEIAERLEYARSLGDLSENSEYQEAKDAQLENEMRIAELEDVLLRSIIVEKPVDHVAVSIGSTVVIRQEDNPDEMHFRLVGSEEIDLSRSKISYESPLGKVLMGRKKDDKVMVITPKGKIKYTILDIM